MKVFRRNTRGFARAESAPGDMNHEYPPSVPTVETIADARERPRQLRGPRGWKRGVAIATAVAVLVGLGALGGSLGSGASHLRTELAVARRALSDLNGHVAGLKWHNDVLNGQITSLQGQVATLRGQVNSLTSTNSFLRGQLASLRGQLATLLAHRPLPNVVGQTLDAIQSLASRYGWSLHIGKQPSSQPQGTVLSQFPKPGTVMSQGASFSVVVAKPLPSKPKPRSSPESPVKAAT